MEHNGEAKAILRLKWNTTDEIDSYILFLDWGWMHWTASMWASVTRSVRNTVLCVGLLGRSYVSLQRHYSSFMEMTCSDLESQLSIELIIYDSQK